jgi:hypothetical protein
MTTAIEQAERAAFDAAMRPTAEQIDEMARLHQAAKLHLDTEREAFNLIEEQCIKLVQAWGTVPAHAEKSRVLKGKLAEMMVTKSDTLTIVEDRVETVKEALEANGYPEYFQKLFALRSKYEIVEGAEAALKSESLPKRLSEKILNLWGRCITVKARKPSLKVTLADPTKPAKKAKKSGPRELAAFHAEKAGK